MWKLWTMFGVDKDDKARYTADIPLIEEIQPSLVRERMRRLNQNLREHGSAEIYTGGLVKPSIEYLINKCAERGYQVWKEAGPCASAHTPTYRICVSPSEYIDKYCVPVSNVPEDQQYALKGKV